MHTFEDIKAHVYSIHEGKPRSIKAHMRNAVYFEQRHRNVNVHGDLSTHTRASSVKFPELRDDLKEYHTWLKNYKSAPMSHTRR